MKKIAITGATGFLGKYLTKKILERGDKVIAFGNSEIRIKEFERAFPEVPIYSLDISHNPLLLKKIFDTHETEYVIHAAALKHVGICENNVSRAIEVNIAGVKNVLEAACSHGVKNCILVSTDKSIDPSCVYGMTKFLGERLFIEQGFGIFQGVNFLYSDGSVLDIWEKQMRSTRVISVNGNATRYFSLVDDVTEKILLNLDTKQKFTVDYCYKIKITDLQKAFSLHWNYANVASHNLLSVEKIDEMLPANVNVIDPSVEEIADLIRIHKLKEIA